GEVAELLAMFFKGSRKFSHRRGYFGESIIDAVDVGGQLQLLLKYHLDLSVPVVGIHDKLLLIDSLLIDSLLTAGGEEAGRAETARPVTGIVCRPPLVES